MQQSQLIRLQSRRQKESKPRGAPLPSLKESEKEGGATLEFARHRRNASDCGQKPPRQQQKPHAYKGQHLKREEQKESLYQLQTKVKEKKLVKGGARIFPLPAPDLRGNLDPVEES